jgi:hypothetical protein
MSDLAPKPDGLSMRAIEGVELSSCILGKRPEKVWRPVSSATIAPCCDEVVTLLGDFGRRFNKLCNHIRTPPNVLTRTVWKMIRFGCNANEFVVKQRLTGISVAELRTTARWAA